MALQTVHRYREVSSVNSGKIGVDLLAPHNYTVDPETGCWNWNWGLAAGYAHVQHSGRKAYVTNILAGLVDPGNYMGVRHESWCDRSCVNPAHLTIGTATDSNIDRVVDGHQGFQKLSAEQAYEIKFQELLYRDGRCYYSYQGQRADLAECYGVSKSTITSIKNRRAWAWLRPEMDIAELRQQRPESYNELC